MSNFVFVLDTDKRPLDPIHPGQARRLLKAKKAAVYRRYPFAIILKRSVPDASSQSCQIKVDPGAATTGLAILQGDRVIWGGELTHRGKAIRDALASRSSLRRGRRNRKTRYRAPRFLNRTRPKGWLPPSLNSRVENILTWIKRLMKFCPVTDIATELVRFDTQLMQDPTIQGEGYQQGTLYQYEVREFVLEKWGRKCAYCGAENVPLEVEHIQPRSRGGSNRPSNLTLACVLCNQAKGNQDIRDFLSDRPGLLLSILSQAKRPLADTAAVNSTRWALFNAFKGLGLPVTTGTGGQTKYNRTTQGVSKTHWHDAAFVGETPQLRFLTQQPLLITAKGHGTRQRAVTDKYGFPKQHRGRFKLSHGFKAGDIVDADIPKGKYAGRYRGLRIAVRTKPTFALYPKNGGKQFDAHCKYLTTVHKADGFAFYLLVAIPPALDPIGYKRGSLATFCWNKSNPDSKIKFPSAIDLHKWLVASVKAENPWYYEVSKCAPQYALRQLRVAWDRCFKKISKAPQFKRKGKHDSFTLDGSIKIMGVNHIHVPKLGVLKTHERLPIGFTPKNVTISRQAERWFISFQLKINPKQTEKTNLSVGVDLGVKHFATLSNGEVFDVTTEYNRIKNKIAQLQYLNRRKVKDSSNRKQAQQVIVRWHYRLSCIRKDWLHKLTTYLVKTFQVICIEDLNISGMLKNGKQAGAISELGWYEFRRQLEYKCLLHGSELRVIGRWEPSSKLHYKCDYKNDELTLKDRVFYCPICDEFIDRDLNASLNIERFGLSLSS